MPHNLFGYLGSGRSEDPPDDIFNLDRWADDIVEFCRLLEIEKPIVLGVSGGGFVAMAYGIRYPSSKTFGEKCMSVYNTTSQPLRDTSIFRPKLAMAFHSLEGIWHTMDLRDQLGEITAQTLVLTGDQDPVTPLQDSIDIEDRLVSTTVTFELVPDAGHGPWRDKPEETFAILEKFIMSTQSV